MNQNSFIAAMQANTGNETPQLDSTASQKVKVC